MNNSAIRASGPPLLALGWGIALAAMGVYVAQVSMARLTSPTYVAVAGTVGAILAVVGFWRRPGWWRGAAVLLIALLCAFEWSMLIGTRLPVYTGPLAVGQPLPMFSTVRANGSPFTNKDLIGDRETVMVFFRGHW